MEDKVMKVRCIDKIFYDNLTINKEYEVLEETENRYRIINDEKGCTLYPKELFKKVEDVLIVECIDNKGYEKELKLGEKYIVKDENERYYFIGDEMFKKRGGWGSTGYYKTRFKPVESQKEAKREYVLAEVMFIKEGTRFKIDNSEGVYWVENGLLRHESKGIIYVSLDILSAKFTKVEEPKQVSFMEAWKELQEKEKAIKSVISDRVLRKGCFDTVGTDELEGQWIIKGDK